MAYKFHRQYIPTDIKEVNKRMQKIRYTKKIHAIMTTVGKA